MNIGDRVVTPDGPGTVKDTRREKDILHGGRVLHGRLFLWVQLDKRNGPRACTPANRSKPE